MAPPSFRTNCSVIGGAVLALLLSLHSTLTSAQQLPGGRAVDVDLQRAQFNSVMFKMIRELTGAWENAWPIAADRNRIIQQYGAEATLVHFTGTLITGNPAIRVLTDTLRLRVREATLGTTDYEAAEGIAYFYGPFELRPRQAGGAVVSGQHATVVKREKNGFRIRAQLLTATEGAAAFPTVPALHPSGPLTLEAMANRATLARYHSANALLSQLRRAWSRADTTELLRLFEDNALIQLPGAPAGTAGIQARRDLQDFLQQSGELHMVTLDFDNAGRLSVLVGGFYLELSGAPARDGYFMLVLTGQGDHWKVRSLVFAPKP